MSRSSKVMSYKVKVVALTGTLPEKLHVELAKKLSLPEHRVIRAPTNRIEHQYSIFKVTGGREALVPRTAAFIMKSTHLLTGGRRGIIFATRKDDGEELRKYMPGVDFIHGDIVGETARRNTIEKWRNGSTGGWLIGTSSLIQGVDYPDVHLVVFMGVPWGMVQFVQGAGRSGRNGQMSRVVLLHAGWSPKPKPEDVQCQTEMNEWVEGGECRRIGISKCMDGVEVTCESLEGANQCDLCHPDSDLADMVNKTPLPLKTQVINLPPLAPPDSNGVSADPPTQLEIPSLRPRNAPTPILANGIQEQELREARNSMVSQCIATMRTFRPPGSPGCIVCWFHDRECHGEHMMSLNEDRAQEMRDLYNWGRPRKGAVVVGGQR